MVDPRKLPPFVREAIEQLMEKINNGEIDIDELMGEEGVGLVLARAEQKEKGRDTRGMMDSLQEHIRNGTEPRTGLLHPNLHMLVEMLTWDLDETLVNLSGYEEKLEEMWRYAVQPEMIWAEEHRDELEFPNEIIQVLKSERLEIRRASMQIMGILRNLILQWKANPLQPTNVELPTEDPSDGDR